MRADFVLDYDLLTVQQPQKLYLIARLTAGTAPSDKERRPLNLSVVIDRSGSMAGEKLDYTRQAAQFLVQNLTARDILSIVLYNDTVQTLVPAETVQHKDTIIQRIDSIKAGGTTNLSGGWLEGCNHVSQNQHTDYLNRVILMTDGLANRGVTDFNKLVGMGKQKFEGGISTTTMGLGSDFNEDLLIAMANASGGAFYFIESPEVAPMIFQEELRGLLNVIGQNLMITLEPTEQVSNVNQLNAYPVEMNGEKITFRMGDVFGDEVKTLALELAIPALNEVGERQIATLHFDYDELTENGAEHRQLTLPVKINVAPAGVQPVLANPGVYHSVLLLKAAQARREAIKQADRGHYKEAAKILEHAASEIETADTSNEELVEEENALRKQAEELAQGSAYYSEFNRKMMSTQAVYTMTDRHSSTQALRIRELERMLKQQKMADASQKPDGNESKKTNGATPTTVTWKERTFPLNGDLIRVGRATQNEIVIEAKGVSRFHCQIKRDSNKLIIEDLNSTNGTVVDGHLLNGPHTLSDGDEVYLCNEKLVFRTV
ncbi:MAG: VWA domain-containing protein [Anaerolineae bacterium]|nr:VWA domain-containing protein [Anaerolineae bacterium]